jgi:hypothetical protein
MIAIVCPACRADNNTTAQCRRCKADLSLVVALEQTRQRCLIEAGAALARGDLAAARARVGQARSLRDGPDAARGLALVSLLERRFDDAWRHYQNARPDG